MATGVPPTTISTPVSAEATTRSPWARASTLVSDQTSVKPTATKPMTAPAARPLRRAWSSPPPVTGVRLPRQPNGSGEGLPEGLCVGSSGEPPVDVLLAWTVASIHSVVHGCVASMRTSPRVLVLVCTKGASASVISASPRPRTYPAFGSLPTTNSTLSRSEVGVVNCVMCTPSGVVVFWVTVAFGGFGRSAGTAAGHWVFFPALGVGHGDAEKVRGGCVLGPPWFLEAELHPAASTATVTAAARTPALCRIAPFCPTWDDAPHDGRPLDDAARGDARARHGRRPGLEVGDQPRPGPGRTGRRAEPATASAAQPGHRADGGRLARDGRGRVGGRRGLGRPAGRPARSGRGGRRGGRDGGGVPGGARAA